ncbi:MAG: hypothetical protein QOJ67_2314 [Acidimicrobiaceae bacterium]|jgi:hypothetical protein
MNEPREPLIRPGFAAFAVFVAVVVLALFWYVLIK